MLGCARGCAHAHVCGLVGMIWRCEGLHCEAGISRRVVCGCRCPHGNSAVCVKYRQGLDGRGCLAASKRGSTLWRVSCTCACCLAASCVLLLWLVSAEVVDGEGVQLPWRPACCVKLPWSCRRAPSLDAACCRSSTQAALLNAHMRSLRCSCPHHSAAMVVRLRQLVPGQEAHRPDRTMCTVCGVQVAMGVKLSVGGYA